MNMNPLSRYLLSKYLLNFQVFYGLCSYISASILKLNNSCTLYSQYGYFINLYSRLWSQKLAWEKQALLRGSWSVVVILTDLQWLQVRNALKIASFKWLV